MSKVALVRCGSYDLHEVYAAVQRGIDLLGGPEAFARPDEKILLKPNWIVADSPDRCATTHPLVFKAVAEVFQAIDVKLSYGDSPGYHTPEHAAHKTGFADVASELGIPLAEFHRGREVIFNEAIQNKKLTVANGVLESDGLISLPKLKTHGFLKLSGAIKNQLGCIPGLLKGEFHVKLPNPVDFAKMLVDINLFLRPRLYIMDGIIGMEGNGPVGGNPRPLNVLLFSEDPVALDATVCRILDLNPELSFTISMGKEAGLGTYRKEEIELLGDPLDGFIDSKFDINREPVNPFKVGNGLLTVINNTLVSKPYIIKNKCIKCGVCVRMCPVEPKAVSWQDDDPKSKPPAYKYDRCIRCYCCQEVCPQGAIELKVPYIRRLFCKWNRSAGNLKKRANPGNCP
jgi:uncharacterized protein (DUF362 family)/Pyruvate/2-oxoacid:ferredoxin oxidoreductase delta subunit